MPTLQKYLGEVYLWHYIPSMPAALVFTTLFVTVTTLHAWKLYRTRMWFCVPFVVGGFFEVIGYVSRAASTNATGSIGPYLIQAIFLLLPPILFAASLYMVYSRIVRAVQGADFSFISPRRTTLIFVTGDYLCLMIQGNAAGLLAKPNLAHIGSAIIATGLVIQVLMFICFMVLCIIWNLRFRRHVAMTGAAIDIPWQSFLNMLYASSTLLLVRNLYRVVEFIMPQDGYLFSHEWPVYAFDGALMLLVMIAFYVWYPDRLKSALEEVIAMELLSQGTGNAERDNRLKYLLPLLWWWPPYWKRLVRSRT